jgi:hypothetical protein
VAHLDLRAAMRASSPPAGSPGATTASVRARRFGAGVFILAAAIGAFDLGSYLYLKRQSVDFVVAGRQREAPIHRLDSTVSWQGQAPGALFGWSRPEPAGTWSAGPVAALALKLPGRPAGDVVLTARVVAFVDRIKLPVRHVDVLVNRVPVAEWRFDGDQPVERAARIPRALIADDGLVRIDFRFREVHSPVELGTGPDPRKLSMQLLEWRLAPVPAVPVSAAP